MSRPRTLTPSASPMHFFGSEVRRAREAAGMSQAELGELVPCDKSTVSRVEASLTMPDEAFAVACDAAFPQAGGFFTRFFGAHQNWTAVSAFPPAFRDFVLDEGEATALFVFEHSTVPGLIQTEDYARAVLSHHPGVTEQQVSERLSARLARQAVLTRDGPPPPFLWAVLDEAALHREIGGAKVMHDALRHVEEMAARPNVTVQVIPATGDYHVGLQGAFTIAEVAGTAVSANVDDITDGRRTDDAATVADVALRFRWLQSLALPKSLSLDMLAKAVDRWNT
jgi:transcriptional regulator with XRE-family HTH domain